MKTSRFLTVVVLLSATSWSGSIAAECLRYGVVSLTGRLVQQTYPGPPDYESLTRGDKPLVIWILQLDRGICVAGSDSSYRSTYSEREIQLVLGADQYARTDQYAQYRHLLGKKITVTGRLVAGGARYEKRFVVAPHEIKRATTARAAAGTWLPQTVPFAGRGRTCGELGRRGWIAAMARRVEQLPPQAAIRMPVKAAVGRAPRIGGRSATQGAARSCVADADAGRVRTFGSTADLRAHLDSLARSAVDRSRER